MGWGALFQGLVPGRGPDFAPDWPAAWVLVWAEEVRVRDESRKMVRAMRGLNISVLY